MKSRFGKNSSSIIRIKSSYFKENKKEVLKQTKMRNLYLKESIRLLCMNCGYRLKKEISFEKDKIGYVLCNNCMHLNGIHEDSDNFCNNIYNEDEINYDETYSAKDKETYMYRLSSVYQPKAEFLYSTLLEEKNPNQLSYLDFGAGSGYFVGALKSIGLDKVSGLEVSEKQVNYANKMLGVNLLNHHNFKETNKVLQATKSNVVSMIGVLEHLQDPRGALKAIKENDHIEYLYLSLPLLSLSVFLEILSPEVFHGQLHGGHTHLYTRESIDYFCKEFKFRNIGEWIFGTDIIDLFRHINVKLDQVGASKAVKLFFENYFSPSIDNLQLELDKSFFSSEIHILLTCKN